METLSLKVKNSIDSHQKMVGVLAPVGNQQPSPFRNSGKGSETIESNLSVNSIKDETRHMMKSELNPSGSMWPAPYLYDIDKDEDIVRPLVKTKAVYCDKSMEESGQLPVRGEFPSSKNGKFNSQDIIDYLNSINESVTLTPKDIEIHLPRLSIHINNSWWYIRKRLDQVTKYIGKSFDITATYGKNKTITINVTGVTNQ